MRRGFTIVEILGVLVLLSMVAAIGGRLFYQSVIALNAERAALNSQSAKAFLLREIRADANRATQLEPLENGVGLKTSDGEIRYRLADKVLTRSDGSDSVSSAFSLVAVQGLTVKGAAIYITFSEEDRVAIMAPFALGRRGE